MARSTRFVLLQGQAKVIDGELHLKGLVASPDGQQIFRTERKGKVYLGHSTVLRLREEISRPTTVWMYETL